MSQLNVKTFGSHQSGGIGTFLLGIVFCLVVVFFVAAVKENKGTQPAGAPADPVSTLVNAPSSGLQPTGELAEIFTYGSDHTDLQRQIKLKEVLGKVVEWSLPVYEVKQLGNGYIIQTSPKFKGDLLGTKMVGTFLHITPRSESDKRRIEGLKTGDLVKFKGVIEDTTMRNLDIKPAILVNEVPVVVAAPASQQPPPNTGPSTVANVPNDVSEDARKCGDLDSCLNVMLQATDPRNQEAINVAAVRIENFPKPPKGNRKAARVLNAKGLGEFRNENFAAAATLLQQAANEDPTDVEVLSNLGMAFHRNQRLSDAQVALKASLAINPRRTSSWVPLAEYFLDAGDPVKASSSLLLAYEFSEKKEKTRAYFETKVAASDRYSPTYAMALKKMDDPWRTTVDGVSVDPAKTKQGSSISKKEAKAILVEKLNSDPDFRNKPEMKELFLCAFDGPLEEAFSGAAVIDVATFERRISASTESMKAAMDRKDPAITLLMLKCAISSGVLEQALKEQGGAGSPPSRGKTSASVPITDMDDLRIDIASSNGRKVRIRGVGNYVMNMFMLKKNPTDMSPMLVDISKLDRDQTRRILQQCADIMTGCRVTVNGTVGKVNYQNGIVAETMEW